jgi:hypothetical protein
VTAYICPRCREESHDFKYHQACYDEQLREDALIREAIQAQREEYAARQRKVGRPREEEKQQTRAELEVADQKFAARMYARGVTYEDVRVREVHTHVLPRYMWGAGR